jgi:polyisoprenoid-binding protein YceI
MVSRTLWKFGLRVVLLAALQTGVATATYTLDSGNTQVSFVVERLGIQWLTARFSDIHGDFTLDRRGPASRVDVSVGIASLECSETRWNDRLRSPEWLDAQRYPRMTYHSSRLELNDGHAIATGELTLHGVTRPVVLNVSLANCQSGGNCRFSARARIKRSDYGLPHGFWTGGDQVEIAISGIAAEPPR